MFELFGICLLTSMANIDQILTNCSRSVSGWFFFYFRGLKPCAHIFKHNVSSRLGVYKVYENWRNVPKNKYVCTYTRNAALEGIWTHCVVWCLAAFYGLSLFNFHWIGSAWRFLPPLYSLHSKEVEKSFEFWCPKKNSLEVF